MAENNNLSFEELIIKALEEYRDKLEEELDKLNEEQKKTEAVREAAKAEKAEAEEATKAEKKTLGLIKKDDSDLISCEDEYWAIINNKMTFGDYDAWKSVEINYKQDPEGKIAFGDSVQIEIEKPFDYVEICSILCYALVAVTKRMVIDDSNGKDKCEWFDDEYITHKVAQAVADMVVKECLEAIYNKAPRTLDGLLKDLGLI